MRLRCCQKNNGLQMKNAFMGMVMGVSVGSACFSAAQEKPNVLFIAVDDLRPELGCYGNAHIVTPNIDKLAAGGVLFERAFCAVPVCGASRNVWKMPAWSRPMSSSIGRTKQAASWPRGVPAPVKVGLLGKKRSSVRSL